VDGASFRITSDGQSHVVEQANQSQTSDCWKRRYAFTLTPRRLSAFAMMCDDLQTAPDSTFRRQRMCTRCTRDGRITLTEEKLIVISDGKRREIALDGHGAYENALVEHFGIVLLADH
jgi:N-hydroxyarylamine O-acetyltransferase